MTSVSQTNITANWNGTTWTATVGGTQNITNQIGVSGQVADTLNGAISSGATSFTGDTADKSYPYAILSPGISGTAEIVTISSVSTYTYNISGILDNNHADGAAVLFLDSLDVRADWLGADATGVADSSTALQAAIDGGANGMIIRFNGTYKITTIIDVEKSVTFSGVNSSTKITCTVAPLRAKASNIKIENLQWYAATPVKLFGLVQATSKLDNTGLIIRDCLFDGVACWVSSTDYTVYTGTVATEGIDIVSDILIKNCEFTGVDSASLYDPVQLGGVTRATLRNLYVHDNGYDTSAGTGIKIYADSSYVNIVDCVCDTNTRDGIDTFDSNNWTVRGCKLINNGVDGLETKYSTTDSTDTDYCIVESCIVRNNGTDGLDVSVHRVIVRGNVCEGNTTGIRLNKSLDSSQPTDESIIADNICRDNSSHGIRCYGDYATLTGNVCNNNNTSNGANGSGIYYEDGTNVIIVGNVCCDDQGTPTQDYGIFCDNLDNAVITNNVLNGNSTDGVGYSGTSGEIHVKTCDNIGNDVNGSIRAIAADPLDGTKNALWVGYQDGWIRVNEGSAINLHRLRGGNQGDTIHLIFTTANTTIQHNAAGGTAEGKSVRLSGAVAYNPPSNTIMSLFFYSGVWHELSRSTNA